MLLAWTIIVLLILVNALYVAGEFSAVGARKSRLRRLADDGNGLAKRMLPVVEDTRELDRYIAVSQVGITLSSLILGAYGQAEVAPRITPLVVALAGIDQATAYSATSIGVLLVLTASQMVLGELVPKSIALQYPTRTALFTVLPMMWSRRVLSWAVKVLNGSGALLLAALRIPQTGHRHVHSPEEIELLIAESRDGGLLEVEEQVRLHRALRLGLRTATSLMVPSDRVAGVSVAAPFTDVLRIVAASPYSRLAVYDGAPGNVIGVLHTKDVVKAFIGRARLTAASLMRPIVRVPPDMPADRLLAFLREQRTHQAFVADGEGAILGLITLEDVVTELLGEVTDEFKGTRRRRRPSEARP